MSGSRSGNTATGVGSGDTATGEEKGSSGDVLDFPILEFCTQLDDYTPTVSVLRLLAIGGSVSNVLTYVIVSTRFLMQSLYTIFRELVLILMIQECEYPLLLACHLNDQNKLVSPFSTHKIRCLLW